ncbi:MAG TPA: ABC transporter permease [Chitinophagaceae bacterium]|nr:ABC transporter permease [Chitinophagaceae bacterium]
MSYSQIRAMLAITKASLRSISRSPSAIVFSFIFPFILILVFGFIGRSGGMQVYKLAVDNRSDTSNAFYQALQQNNSIRLLRFNTEEDMISNLHKGAIAGVIYIKATAGETVPYKVSLQSTTASNNQWPQVRSFIESVINSISNKIYTNRPAYAIFDFDPARDVREIRQYKTIDFILPGQLGFSLLSSGVFGVAFMFFNLRNTLVLKRFFATPINRTFIILGEGLSRVIFQMITAVVIIGVGYFFFGFTLIHHVRTFLDMLVLSFIGLLVFMGFGFIISGTARNDSSIPPFANLITLPQFLLGGTFFSIEAFPNWLQPISRALPLTHLNAAMRKVAFEGQTLWQVKAEIAILIAWGILVYAIAVKVFKWE